MLAVWVPSSLPLSSICRANSLALARAAVLDIAVPGEKILMTSYGSGAGSDTYIFTVTPKIEEKRDRLVTIKEQIDSPHWEYVDYTFYQKMKDNT